MKLRFLLPLVLFPFLLSSQNNSYIEFPDSNAVWNFNYSMNCFQNGTGDENYSIEISGDTLINNLEYQKLNTPYIESYTIGSCHYPTTGYKGAIREDIQQRKVYIIPPTENSEQLLYDFNMQIGDTVKGYTQGLDTPLVPNIVISIDSVLIGSQYHKRWFLNDCYDEYLIEGVGSTFGLIEQSFYCTLDLAEFKLICFSKDGNNIYPSSSTNCNLITSINEKSSPQTQISIYPNPVIDELNLLMDANVETSALKIVIFDLQGKKLREHEFPVSNPKVSFPVKELEAGIYLFRLTDGKELDIMEKIVVQ